MPLRVDPQRRIATTLGWPVGMLWTAWHYTWRILPVHRCEAPGTLPDDLPPPLPAQPDDEVQRLDEGAGPLLHRVYSCTVLDAKLSAHELMGRIAANPGRVTPRQIARFHQATGTPGEMRPGDEFLVHMPGPWNGPVRVVDVRPDGFRFATLRGHLEAGQIEWRAWQDAELHFAIESWARPGDRLSALLHDRLRMAKEVQLYMWTTVLERVTRLAGGRLADGAHVSTRRVPPAAFG